MSTQEYIYILPALNDTWTKSSVFTLNATQLSRTTQRQFYENITRAFDQFKQSTAKKRPIIINPSQEGYYNSINPLVKGVPHIFTSLHLGAPHIHGPQIIRGFRP